MKINNMATRKRIRSHNPIVTNPGGGGGGGSATVVWGPNFGESQELTVGSSVSLPSYGTTTTNTPGVTVNFSDAAVFYVDSAGATVTIGQYAIPSYLDWADANVTTTSITNAGNAIDKNTTTFAHAQAASTASPTWLNNITTNFTLVSSFPDFSTPFTNFTIDSVTWEHSYQSIHTTSGVVTTAATANVPISYSVDDGGAFTTTETVTSIASGLVTRSVDLTAAIGGDWTKITQFRTRWTGSITSGIETGVQSIQQFRIHYSRLNIEGHWDNP